MHILYINYNILYDINVVKIRLKPNAFGLVVWDWFLPRVKQESIKNRTDGQVPALIVNINMYYLLQYCSMVSYSLIVLFPSNSNNGRHECFRGYACIVINEYCELYVDRFSVTKAG